MGIQDRDYMKRPPKKGGDESLSVEKGDDDPLSVGSKAEEFFSGFLRKHPRFFLSLGIVFLILVIIALLLSKFAN